MARRVTSLFLKAYFLLQDPASAPRQREELDSYPPTLLLWFEGIRDEVSQVVQQAQGLIRGGHLAEQLHNLPPDRRVLHPLIRLHIRP